jgi:hypothetical protein
MRGCLVIVVGCRYKSTQDTDTPPSDGWITGSDGSGSPPIISYGGGGGGGDGGSSGGPVCPAGYVLAGCWHIADQTLLG